MDKGTKIVLFIILLLGAALRAWGLGFGLPYQFHQDEPMIVNHALAYGTGDLNPHFFVIPPLTSYILFFFYGIYYLLANLSGHIKGAEAFAISFFNNPAPFYIIGRIVIGIIPSILNIILVYKLAAEFFSKKTAVYSSIVMTFAFLNIVNAHYIYTDNLLVLFALLSYIAMVKLIKSPVIINYVLSAVFIGIASAVKYNAILLLIPFLLAHLFSGARRPFDMKILIGMITVPIIFILFNPYAILDWKLFLLSVTSRIMHVYTGWTHHILYSLFEGIGIWAAIFSFIGLLLVLRRNHKIGILLLSFPVIFYLHLVLKSQPYSRYALALVPFLSIGLGYIFYGFLYEKYRTKGAKFAIVLMSLVILLPSIAKSIRADILFAKEDSRMMALEWIDENISSSDKIAVDHIFFSPPLKQSKSQLEDKRSILNKQPELEGLKYAKLDLQLKAIDSKKRYAVYYITEGGEGAGQFLNFWPVVKNDLKKIKEEGIQYIIINNMNMSKSMREFDEAISAMYRPIAIFSSYKNSEIRRSYDEIETTCIPITSRELFSRQRFGPCISIYKIQ